MAAGLFGRQRRFLNLSINGLNNNSLVNQTSHQIMVRDFTLVFMKKIY
jgi:hypothetical protein